ncbi:MAG: lipid-A-disaccharide synthase N-terminal domain-containing protein [Verrucomicrobia bacterium]|nr:lipid-A-disaccharide synthase N-terminal domain-containing protein [Verrucomicrobiota bacterium]MDE3100492.1 lipid-A-disaccharide synthase N-terminal domain-containing protein [Verrucomicrobiota bacterium]
MHGALFSDGKFLGIEWSVWKVIGWLGNAVFFSRFYVQWYVTEKKKQVVVPQAFWWLSLAGSLLLLSYALRQRDSVFIFAYAFTWLPYIRNLVIHRRNKAGQKFCGGCGMKSPPKANFCPGCGLKLTS